MEYIWQLAVAIFMIVTAAFLMLFSYIFQGALLSGVAIWLAFGLFVFGAVKGVLTMIWHRAGI